MAVILSKKNVIPVIPLYNGPVTINITGSGDSNYCYVTINNSKYYTETNNIISNTGGTIGFLVTNIGTSFPDATVTIDGETVIKVGMRSDDTSHKSEAYTWDIPEGIRSININLEYGTVSGKDLGNCFITVITS